MSEFLMISLLVLTAVLWVWACLDISRSSFQNRSLQFIWIAIILLFPVLGSIIYFQLGHKLKKEPRKFQPEFSNRTT